MAKRGEPVVAGRQEDDENLSAEFASTRNSPAQRSMDV